MSGEQGRPAAPAVAHGRAAPRRPLLTVYSRPGCHLCEEAMTLLRGLQEELGYDLRELDIEADEGLHRAYLERIPVLTVDGEELCEHFVDEAAVRDRLESRR